VSWAQDYIDSHQSEYDGSGFSGITLSKQSVLDTSIPTVGAGGGETKQFTLQGRNNLVAALSAQQASGQDLQTSSPLDVKATSFFNQPAPASPSSGGRNFPERIDPEKFISNVTTNPQGTVSDVAMNLGTATLQTMATAPSFTTERFAADLAVLTGADKLISPQTQGIADTAGALYGHVSNLLPAVYNSKDVALAAAFYGADPNTSIETNIMGIGWGQAPVIGPLMQFIQEVQGTYKPKTVKDLYDDLAKRGITTDDIARVVEQDKVSLAKGDVPLSAMNYGDRSVTSSPVTDFMMRMAMDPTTYLMVPGVAGAIAKVGVGVTTATGLADATKAVVGVAEGAKFLGAGIAGASKAAEFATPALSRISQILSGTVKAYKAATFAATGANLGIRGAEGVIDTVAPGWKDDAGNPLNNPLLTGLFDLNDRMLAFRPLSSNAVAVAVTAFRTPIHSYIADASAAMNLGKSKLVGGLYMEPTYSVFVKDMTHADVVSKANELGVKTTRLGGYSDQVRAVAQDRFGGVGDVGEYNIRTLVAHTMGEIIYDKRAPATKAGEMISSANEWAIKGSVGHELVTDALKEQARTGKQIVTPAEVIDRITKDYETGRRPDQIVQNQWNGSRAASQWMQYRDVATQVGEVLHQTLADTFGTTLGQMPNVTLRDVLPVEFIDLLQHKVESTAKNGVADLEMLRTELGTRFQILDSIDPDFWGALKLPSAEAPTVTAVTAALKKAAIGAPTIHDLYTVDAAAEAKARALGGPELTGPLQPTPLAKPTGGAIVRSAPKTVAETVASGGPIDVSTARDLRGSASVGQVEMATGILLDESGFAVNKVTRVIADAGHGAEPAVDVAMNVDNLSDLRVAASLASESRGTGGQALVYVLGEDLGTVLDKGKPIVPNAYSIVFRVTSDVLSADGAQGVLDAVGDQFEGAIIDESNGVVRVFAEAGREGEMRTAAEAVDAALKQQEGYSGYDYEKAYVENVGAGQHLPAGDERVSAYRESAPRRLSYGPASGVATFRRTPGGFVLEEPNYDPRVRLDRQQSPAQSEGVGIGDIHQFRGTQPTAGGEYVYHVTSPQSAYDIRASGSLEPVPADRVVNGSFEGRQWPDGTTEPRVYVNVDPEAAYPGSSGQGAILAVQIDDPGNPIDVVPEGGGTTHSFIREPVPTSKMFILGGDGRWYPFESFFDSPVNSFEVTPEAAIRRAAFDRLPADVGDKAAQDSATRYVGDNAQVHGLNAANITYGVRIRTEGIVRGFRDRLSSAYDAIPIRADRRLRETKVSEASHRQLVKEVESQYAHAEADGYQIEVWDQEGQPYADQAARNADLQNNKHLYVVREAPTSNVIATPPGADMYSHTVAHGGGTFDVATGKEMGLTSGYGVGVGKMGLIAENNAADVAAKYAQVSKTGTPHIGTWVDPDTGKVSVDPTQVVMDREQAIGLAQSRGEKAIFDFSTMQDIPLEGEALRPVPNIEGPAFKPMAARSARPVLGETFSLNPELTNGDAFHALHLIYGYAATGADLSPEGAFTAVMTHARMFSPEARKAMLAETEGRMSYIQNAGSAPDYQAANARYIQAANRVARKNGITDFIVSRFPAVTREVARDSADMMNILAETWAKRTGRSPNEFIQSWFEDSDKAMRQRPSTDFFQATGPEADALRAEANQIQTAVAQRERMSSDLRKLEDENGKVIPGKQVAHDKLNLRLEKHHADNPILGRVGSGFADAAGDVRRLSDALARVGDARSVGRGFINDFVDMERDSAPTGPANGFLSMDTGRSWGPGKKSILSRYDANGNLAGVMWVTVDDSGRAAGEHISVRPDARRQGIASSLYAEADSRWGVVDSMGSTGLSSDGRAAARAFLTKRMNEVANSKQSDVYAAADTRLNEIRNTLRDLMQESWDQAPPEWMTNMGGGWGRYAPVEAVRVPGHGNVYVPGGLAGLDDPNFRFSLWDMHKIRAQAIDPNALYEADPGLAYKVYRKMFQSMQRDLADPIETMNLIQFAILSPSKDFHVNEGQLSLVRIRNMADAERMAAYAGDTPRLPNGDLPTSPPKTWSVMDENHKITEGDALRFRKDYEMQDAADMHGPMRSGYNTHLWYLVRAADQFVRSEKAYSDTGDSAGRMFSKPAHLSNEQYAERLMNQVSGAGLKVGTFGPMLADPITGERGTIDRHMMRYLNDFIDKNAALLTDRAMSEGRDPGFYLAKFNDMKPQLGSKVRSFKPGKAPAGMEHLEGVDPGNGVGKSVRTFMDTDYERANAILHSAMDLEEKRMQGIDPSFKMSDHFGLGGFQWFVWDRVRDGVIEPHVNAYPHLAAFERFSGNKIGEAIRLSREYGRSNDSSSRRIPTLPFDPKDIAFPQRDVPARTAEAIGSMTSDIVKGFTRWTDDGRSAVQGTRAADATTVIHEMIGHANPERLKELLGTRDFYRLTQHLNRETGIEAKGTTWSPAHTERFAQEVEQYFFEGTTKNPDVGGIYARIKDYFATIYSHVAAGPLGKKLSIEVRGILDRVFETDDSSRFQMDVSKMEQGAADMSGALTARLGESRRVGLLPEHINEEFNALADSPNVADWGRPDAGALTARTIGDQNNPFAKIDNGLTLWSAERDAITNHLIPPLRGVRMTGKGSWYMSVVSEFERKIAQEAPQYTLMKPLGKDAYFLDPKLLSSLTDDQQAQAYYFGARTALGRLLVDYGPLGKATSFMRWFVTPVKGADMQIAAHQSFYDEMNQLGFKPSEAAKAIDFLTEESREHKIRDIPLFRGPENMFAGTVEGAIREGLAKGGADAERIAAYKHGTFVNAFDRSANRWLRDLQEKNGMIEHDLQSVRGAGRPSLVAKKGFLSAADFAYRMGQGEELGPVGQVTGKAGWAVRTVTKTFYHLFRFMADPRWWAMNLAERDFFALGRNGWGGTRAHHAALEEPAYRQHAGSFAEADSRLQYDPGFEGMRNTQAYIAKNFSREYPDLTREVVKNVIATDETGAGALYHMFGEGKTPEQYATELDDWLYQFDQEGPTAVDKALKGLRDDMALKPGTPEYATFNAMADRVYQLHEQSYTDLRNTFSGSGTRTNIERVLNSYWLYWPISYQIKAFKWMFGVLTHRAMGYNTNAGAAAILNQVVQHHNQLLQTDPQYASIFNDHPATWGLLGMMSPILPWDAGLSLSRPLRYGIANYVAPNLPAGEAQNTVQGYFPKYTRIDNPVTFAFSMAKMGPLYTFGAPIDNNRGTWGGPIPDIAKEWGIPGPWGKPPKK
jgi:hypothetical protein